MCGNDVTRLSDLADRLYACLYFLSTRLIYLQICPSDKLFSEKPRTFHLSVNINYFSTAFVSEIWCSHHRSHELFIATFTEQSCPFVSFPCQDYAEYESGECQRLDQATIGRMGMDADKYSLSGNHYLQTTNNTNAFCGKSWIAKRPRWQKRIVLMDTGNRIRMDRFLLRIYVCWLLLPTSRKKIQYR